VTAIVPRRRTRDGETPRQLSAPWLAALALAIIFLLLWAGIGTRDLPGDLILYFDYANYVDDGLLPYRDVRIEYPPLALIPILLPFFSGTGAFISFEAAFAAEMAALAIAGGWLIWRLMARLMPDASARERHWRMVAYVAAWPLLGQIVTTRFDALPTVLTIAAVALWIERRERAAWIILALGVGVKLFPVVIAPLFAIDLLVRRGPRAAVTGGLTFMAACVAAFLPGLLLSPDGLRHALTYHADRGMQLESVYANGLLVVNKLTGFAVGTDHVFGGFEAISAWTDELKPISALVQLAALGGVYLLYTIYRQGCEQDPSSDELLIVGATLALVAFIVAGKVFSPQYLIWLMPFIPLLPVRIARDAVIVFFAALVLTQIIYPYTYESLIDRAPFAIGLLTARNAMMLALIALLIEGLSASPREGVLDAG
jgi:hypothetical protein